MLGHGFLDDFALWAIAADYEVDLGEALADRGNHVNEQVHALAESESGDDNYVDGVEGVTLGGVRLEAAAIDGIRDD